MLSRTRTRRNIRLSPDYLPASRRPPLLPFSLQNINFSPRNFFFFFFNSSQRSDTRMTREQLFLAQEKRCMCHEALPISSDKTRIIWNTGARCFVKFPDFFSFFFFFVIQASVSEIFNMSYYEHFPTGNLATFDVHTAFFLNMAKVWWLAVGSK